MKSGDVSFEDKERLVRATLPKWRLKILDKSPDYADDIERFYRSRCEGELINE